MISYEYYITKAGDGFGEMVMIDKEPGAEMDDGASMDMSDVPMLRWSDGPMIRCDVTG